MSFTNWCFTLNWPTDMIDFEHLGDANVRYAIFSEEVGETGNYHFQGYVQLINKQRLSYMRKLVPSAHWEVQRAKANDDARNYCAKVGDATYISGPYEYGAYTKVGARTDLTSVKEDLDAGMPMTEIADVHFGAWVRYHKAFTTYRTIKTPKRCTIETVTVIYGGTGLGKTHWATAEFPDPHLYWATRPNNGSYYFELYNGEKAILFDDFYGWLPQDFLLRLCQARECRLPFRGGEAQCVSTNIIFTTNKRPWTWYKRDMANFNRRVTKWIHFTSFKTYFETDDAQRFRDHVIAHEFIESSSNTLM